MGASVFIDNLQPVTTRIERIVANVPGWTSNDQLLALHMLAVMTAPLGGDIVEIGSWCGRSTAVLGHAVASAGGHVWAIDLFPRLSDWHTNPDGSHSLSVNVDGVSIDSCKVHTLWDKPFRQDVAPVYARHDSILEAFRATIDAEGLNTVVTPYRGTGAMFAAAAPSELKVRLAFLDGDHSYEAVCADIDAAKCFLMPGGWIAFDDAFSVYYGVDAAIRDRVLNSDAFEYGHQLCRKLFVARRREHERR